MLSAEEGLQDVGREGAACHEAFARFHPATGWLPPHTCHEPQRTGRGPGERSWEGTSDAQSPSPTLRGDAFVALPIVEKDCGVLLARMPSHLCLELRGVGGIMSSFTGTCTPTPVPVHLGPPSSHHYAPGGAPEPVKAR